MSVRVCVILFAVLIGLASAAKLKQPAEKKGECVDNTLYAKYVCQNQKDGEKLLVPGSCSDYYECSKGESKRVSCSKFFDPETKKCVKKSECVEVDNTNCVISTPPPCGVTPSPPTPSPPTPSPPTPSPPTPSPPTPSPPTPSPPTPSPPTPTPCECPEPPSPITCPPISCPTAPTCPPPIECPAPVECPAPPTCPEPEPEPTPKPPCGTPGPCNSYYNPDDLYGTYACKHQKNGTMLIVPSNCSQYFYCIGGWSYLKDCGSKLNFNPLIGACDQKSNVPCPSG